MRKLFFNVLMGIGGFFTAYPIGRMLRKAIYSKGGADGEIVYFIAAGILLLVIGIWGYKKEKRKEELNSGF